MKNFSGAKIALIAGNSIVTIMRDDIPTIVFPGMWDLPGGQRDDLESPDDCVLRETYEELGLRLSPDRIIWRRLFPSINDANLPSWFMVAPIDHTEITQIRFGNEGQMWKLMTLQEFLADTDAIGPLKDRVRQYLDSLSIYRL